MNRREEDLADLCIDLNNENKRLKEVLAKACLDNGFRKTALEKETGTTPEFVKVIKKLCGQIDKQTKWLDKRREEVATLQNALTTLKSEKKELSKLWYSLKPVLMAWKDYDDGSALDPSEKELFEWIDNYERSKKPNPEV